MLCVVSCDTTLSSLKLVLKGRLKVELGIILGAVRKFLVTYTGTGLTMTAGLRIMGGTLYTLVVVAATRVVLDS